MLDSPCSEYYSINNLNNLTRKAGPARTLSKNFDTFEEILNSLDSRPDILGITETKRIELSITYLDLNTQKLMLAGLLSTYLIL